MLGGAGLLPVLEGRDHLSGSIRQLARLQLQADPNKTFSYRLPLPQVGKRGHPEIYHI